MRSKIFASLLLMMLAPFYVAGQTTEAPAPEKPIVRRFEWDLWHLGGSWQSQPGGYTARNELRYNFRKHPFDIGLELNRTGYILLGYLYDHIDIDPDYVQTGPRAETPTWSLSLLSDYNFRRGHIVAPFVGAGIGYALYEESYPGNISPTGRWYRHQEEFALFTLRAGIEFWEHLRLTLSARVGHQGYCSVGLTLGATLFGGTKNAPNGQRFFYAKSRKHKDQAADFYQKHQIYPKPEAPYEDTPKQLYYTGNSEADRELEVRRWEFGGDAMFLGIQTRDADYIAGMNVELRYNLRKAPIHLALRYHNTLSEGSHWSVNGNVQQSIEHSTTQNGLSLLSDYNFKRGHKANPFVGVGVGFDVMDRDVWTWFTEQQGDEYSSTWQWMDGGMQSGALFTLRGGVELIHHLRFTGEVRLGTHGYHTFMIGFGAHFGGGLRIRDDR